MPSWAWFARSGPRLGAGAYRVTGRAVRAADDDGRRRLRRAWYLEQVSSLFKRMLLLLLAEAGLLFVATAFLVGRTPANAGTGETLEESVASSALSVALIFAWPLLVVVLLRVLRWRELLVVAALAVLTVTTLRGLAVVAAHLAAVVSTGTSLDGSNLWIILDPIDWTFIILGVAFFRGARRLSDQAGQILHRESREISPARKYWSRGLLTMTSVLALLFVVWTVAVRYDESRYVIKPGVDPRREHNAAFGLQRGRPAPRREGPTGR